MLVLSRKPNESIIIGDDVEVKIVEVKGDYVKLGINAPRAIPVHRKEIYEAIQRENVQAAQSNVADIDTLGDFFNPKEEKKPEAKKEEKKEKKKDT